MKIAFLSRYQNNTNRGAESFVVEISKRLARFYEVDVLTGEDSDSLSLIFKNRYDLVIPINGRMQSLKVSLGRFLGRYKILISGHAGIGRDDLWNIFVRPDVFVALTRNGFNWAKKWSAGTKVVKIPNGVDLEKFTPNGGKVNLGLKSPVILSVGALTWYKHHERVIEAVSKLREGSLLIVGEGEREKELKGLGNKLLGDRFKLVSFDYKDMPKVYRSADLFTLPSWDREAFGLVYLEAMATNIPVVAPNDSSRKEIVGDGGLLVDTSDTESYAKTLEKALKIKWGNKPRQQAEKFSWEKVSAMYKEAIDSLFKKT